MRSVGNLFSNCKKIFLVNMIIPGNQYFESQKYFITRKLHEQDLSFVIKLWHLGLAGVDVGASGLALKITPLGLGAFQYILNTRKQYRQLISVLDKTMFIAREHDL